MRLKRVLHHPDESAAAFLQVSCHVSAARSRTASLLLLLERPGPRLRVQQAGSLTNKEGKTSRTEPNPPVRTAPESLRARVLRRGEEQRLYRGAGAIKAAPLQSGALSLASSRRQNTHSTPQWRILALSASHSNKRVVFHRRPVELRPVLRTLLPVSPPLRLPQREVQLTAAQQEGPPNPHPNSQQLPDAAANHRRAGIPPRTTDNSKNQRQINNC